jgi:hypothetical protein
MKFVSIISDYINEDYTRNYIHNNSWKSQKISDLTGRNHVLPLRNPIPDSLIGVQCPDLLWGPHRLLPNGYQVLFPGTRAAGV